MSIKVEELRVGNKLLRNGIVVTIDAMSIFDIWKQSEEYSGIPITGPVLEKCGFEKGYEDEDEYCIYRDESDDYLIIDSKTFMSTAGRQQAISDCDCMASKRVYLAEIKEVHQLQNLYYAIEGKELNVRM